MLKEEERRDLCGSANSLSHEPYTPNPGKMSEDNFSFSLKRSGQGGVNGAVLTSAGGAMAQAVRITWYNRGGPATDDAASAGGREIRPKD